LPWWQPITWIRKEPSIQTKALPKPLTWTGLNSPGHQQRVGDSGILCTKWCQYRYEVQDETSTQLHLWRRSLF
jgi:hypothetical protein